MAHYSSTANFSSTHPMGLMDSNVHPPVSSYRMEVHSSRACTDTARRILDSACVLDETGCKHRCTTKVITASSKDDVRISLLNPRGLVRGVVYGNTRRKSFAIYGFKPAFRNQKPSQQQVYTRKMYLWGKIKLSGKGTLHAHLETGQDFKLEVSKDSHSFRCQVKACSDDRLVAFLKQDATSKSNGSHWTADVCQIVDPCMVLALISVFDQLLNPVHDKPCNRLPRQVTMTPRTVSSS